MTESLRSRRVLIDGNLRPATVHVRNGVISAITPYHDAPADTDFGEDVIMPGLVDTHVHVNEPGRTEWEGFTSATRAAAAGGVTTLFDMPLNSIPATTTVAALHAKQDSARGRITVNVGFIGGVVPGNAGELRALHAGGVTLFKCFLVPSGVDEFPNVGEADLREALPILAALDATLLVHAELPDHIVAMPSGDPRHYSTYLASRPDLAETEAVALVIGLAEEFGARVHIVHVSSARTLPLISAARARGVRITCETCPHYLFFSAEEIADGATELKCAPPIRSAATRHALWNGLLDGQISLVASDHSPCPPAMKDLPLGDFFQAWGGIASLQLGLPAVWHEAQTRGGSIEQVAEWMSAAPAKLAGLSHSKGRLAPGFDADIVIWNPETTVAVDDMTLYHRHSLTPYRGHTLTGLVRATYVHGVQVYLDGRVATQTPGSLLNDDR
ncbi:MAG: allantoinase [Gemmatimonadetes bacterium]|nr:allantoinase [Gemmatimonadota bacterium]